MSPRALCMCVSSKAPFDSTVNLLSDNLDQTAQFWEEVIGLPLWTRVPVDLSSKRGWLSRLLRKAGVSASTDGAIITLVTEEVDEAVVRLKERGVAFEGVHPDCNIYHAFLETRTACSSRSRDSKILDGLRLCRRVRASISKQNLRNPETQSKILFGLAS